MDIVQESSKYWVRRQRYSWQVECLFHNDDGQSLDLRTEFQGALSLCQFPVSPKFSGRPCLRGIGEHPMSPSGLHMHTQLSTPTHTCQHSLRHVHFFLRLFFCACMCALHVEVRGYLWKSVLSFCHGDKTWVLMFGSKRLYPLSHLTS